MIEMIGVQTRDRPNELARFLDSLLEHLSRYGRSPRIMISDDSAEAGLLRNAAAIEAARAGYPGQIDHLTPDDRLSWARTLSDAAHLPLETVKAAIAPGPELSRFNSFGAGRNGLLLRSAGRHILMLDDDIVMRTHSNPFRKEGLMVTGSFADGYSYFRDAEEAIAAFPVKDIDYLREHERWLGKGARDILEGFKGKVVLENRPDSLNQNFAHAVRTGGIDGFKVNYTHSGSVGHSWSRFFSLFDGCAERRPHDVFGGTPAELLFNEETPAVSRIDDRYVLSRGSVCVGLNIGIDASSLVPPFAPLHRAQDNIMGNIAFRAVPGHVSFRMPIAIEHIRPEPRKRSPDQFAHLLTVAVLTNMLINESAAGGAGGASERLSFIGRNLRGMADMAPTDLEILEILLRSEISRRVYAIAKHANLMHGYYKPIAPSWWIDEAMKLSASARARCELMDQALLFSDVTEWHGDGTGGLRSFQDYLRMFGSVLEAWPAMFHAAAGLTR